MIYTLIICNYVVWGGNWYVDPVSGSDSNAGYYDYAPFSHIWKALQQASSNDSILLKSGDYHNEGINYISGDYGYTYVNINKLIKMNRYRTNTPRIAVAYAGGESTVNLSIMLINISGAKINNIKFDGYNDLYNIDTQPDSLLPHHVTIRITKDGGNTTIDNCEFKHMGRSLNTSISNRRHEAIICSNPYPDTTFVISNVTISNNNFINNPFDTSHGHEIYLTNNSSAVISNNKIFSSGTGVPIRFTYRCSDILINNNYVLGAAGNGFIHDWNTASTDSSSGIRVTNNVFSDSTVYGFPDSTVYGADVSADYKGPFNTQSGGVNDRYAFISEFTNNVISDKLPFADDYATSNKIYGATSDSVYTYIAIYRDDEHDWTRVYQFIKKNGPICKYLGTYTSENRKPNGLICNTADSVIVGTFYGGNNYLHKFSKSTGAISEYSVPTSTKKFSAIGPYAGNYFFRLCR